MSEKITADHLGRKAYVYIRQSSMEQVRHNLKSRRRQYGLADKARAMGWNEVEVIDEDLGRSGASALQRTGFQRLVAEVGLGHCGAIFSLEVSRLARNNTDWYQLLDLCALAQTLLVDSEAVYVLASPGRRVDDLEFVGDATDINSTLFRARDDDD